MKRMCRLFRYRKTAFLLTLLCNVGVVTVTILWNRQLAEMIDRMQAGVGFGFRQIKESIVLLLACAVLQAGVHFFSSYTGEYAAHDLRMCLAQAMYKKPYSLMIKESTGEQISSQQNEMEEINQYISEHFFLLCSDAINFVCTLCFLLMQNAKLTLLCNAPVVLLAVYTSVSGKVIYGFTKQEQEQVKKLNGVMETVLSLFPVLRIYEAEKLLQKKYLKAVEGWKKAAVSEERVKARLMSVSGMLSCLPLLLLLFVGGTMVVKGNFSMGMLYVFVNLSGNVSGIMTNMPGHIASFRRFCGNLDRVWESIDGEGGNDNGHSVTRG